MKITPARQTIYKIIKDTSGPIDTASILDHILSKKLSIDRATVFRSLNFFLKNKLINKVEFSDGKTRYEVETLPPSSSYDLYKLRFSSRYWSVYNSSFRKENYRRKAIQGWVSFFRIFWIM